MNVEDKYFRIALLALFLLVCGYLISVLSPILAPFLIAALLAYLGDPLVDRLEQRGLGRTGAVCLVFLSLTLLAVVGFLLTLPLLIDQYQLLLVRLQDAVQWFQLNVLSELKASFSKNDLAKTGSGFNFGSAGGVLLSVWKQISGSGLALIGWLSSMALIPVVTFYLLRDWDILVAKIQDLLPRSIVGRVALIAKECDEILGAFIRGQMLVMAALAVLYSIGLWIVGLELALAIGLMAGLASLVPYLGFVVGISAASLAGWFQFHDVWILIQIAAVFTVGQLLEGMVLTPQLVGDRIGLHPLAVIFALLAGAQLFGFVGVLLGLPVAAVLMVMLRHLHDSYKNSDLYGSAPLPCSSDSTVIETGHND